MQTIGVRFYEIGRGNRFFNRRFGDLVRLCLINIGETKKAEAMNNMVKLTEDNFEAEVIQAATPVIVDFYAPWCGPCKMLAPILEQFAGEFTSRLKFAKANVDETPELAACFEITGVPTLMLFRHGESVDTVVGFPEPRQIKAWLNKAANAVVNA